MKYLIIAVALMMWSAISIVVVHYFAPLARRPLFSEYVAGFLTWPFMLILEFFAHRRS